MTYPPQQPGQQGSDPYGQQPGQPGPYGQSSYQGLGSYSGGQGGPPKKKNTGMIVAIVAIVVMVLGGGGVAVYFLTKGDDKPSDSASSEKTNGTDSKNTASNDPSDDATSDRDPESGSNDGDASNTPDDVRDDYMAAYENKDFGDVVDNACNAYKEKFGTDTSALENQLAGYDITATPDGEPDVNGNTASAKIDLKLAASGTTEEPKILIKIVEEDGQWRFCGEGKP